MSDNPEFNGAGCQDNFAECPLPGEGGYCECGNSLHSMEDTRCSDCLRMDKVGNCSDAVRATAKLSRVLELTVHILEHPDLYEETANSQEVSIRDAHAIAQKHTYDDEVDDVLWEYLQLVPYDEYEVVRLLCADVQGFVSQLLSNPKPVKGSKQYTVTPKGSL